MKERYNFIRDLAPSLRIRVTRQRDRVCIIVRRGEQIHRRYILLEEWQGMTEGEASKMTRELMKVG